MNEIAAGAAAADRTRIVEEAEAKQLPALCDGRTGALVARLNVNDPDGWFDGSPPWRCQRLTTTVLAEILPHGLVLGTRATVRS